MSNRVGCQRWQDAATAVVPRRCMSSPPRRSTPLLPQLQGEAVMLVAHHGAIQVAWHSGASRLQLGDSAGSAHHLCTLHACLPILPQARSLCTGCPS